MLQHRGHKAVRQISQWHNAEGRWCMNVEGRHMLIQVEGQHMLIQVQADMETIVKSNHYQNCGFDSCIAINKLNKNDKLLSYITWRPKWSAACMLYLTLFNQFLHIRCTRSCGCCWRRHECVRQQRLNVNINRQLTQQFSNPPAQQIKVFLHFFCWCNFHVK